MTEYMKSMVVGSVSSSSQSESLQVLTSCQDRNHLTLTDEEGGLSHCRRMYNKNILEHIAHRPKNNISLTFMQHYSEVKFYMHMLFSGILMNLSVKLLVVSSEAD